VLRLSSEARFANWWIFTVLRLISSPAVLCCSAAAAIWVFMSLMVATA